MKKLPVITTFLVAASFPGSLSSSHPQGGGRKRAPGNEFALVIGPSTCKTNNASRYKPLLLLSLFSIRFIMFKSSIFGSRGTRLPSMCPGFDSCTRCHMWVAFVVGSLLCSERFFSGYSGFPLSSKTNISKFQFHPGMHGHF